MKSHEYQLRRSDLVRVGVPPLVTMVAFAGLMHLAALAGWLPSPRPTFDVDRTLLVHQAEAARGFPETALLLIGDSSCLMDVDAGQLSRDLEVPVLNLATLSYLDLAAYSRLVREHVRLNPGSLRTIVVLMHPEALRRPAPESHHVRLLHSILAGTDFVPAGSAHARVLHWLGLDRFRSRLWARVVPSPLGGAYGRYYGFSSEFERHLARHGGSAVEPDRQPFRGNAEYRLAPAVEAGSRVFRQAVPDRVKLFVGITPVPAGFAGAEHAAIYRELLARWGGWLGADGMLDGLPAVLPDELFARTTHLNGAGAAHYTAVLARELERVEGLLPSPLPERD